MSDTIVNNLLEQMHDTQVFLRIAAVELRRIANDSPDIAVFLRHIAGQLDTEVKDLADKVPQWATRG